MKNHSAKVTVSLHGIRVQAPIGLYPEEKRTGNLFELDLDVELPATLPGPLPFLDYLQIHTLAESILKEPGDILETYVQALAESMLESIPQAQRIQVRLRKYHPPFPGETLYAQVSLDWTCGP